jgi:DNA polymerase-3 subunit epsilon
VKGRGKFALWVLVLFAGGIAVPAATGVALVAALTTPDQQTVLRVLAERAPILVFGGIVLLALCAGIVNWFFAAYVIPARALAEQTRIVRGVNDAGPVSSEGAPELVTLAHEIERLAAEKHRLRGESDARVREALSRLDEERNRLAALMSELAEGVLVCNAAGRILLYNDKARALLAGGDDRSAATRVGLGRSVFSLIDRDQVVHAMEKLEQSSRRSEAAPRTRFVAPAGSGRLVKFEAAPYHGAGGGLAGIVFTLSDVTGLLERESQHLSLLQSIARGARAPVANIRAAAENLALFPNMEADRRGQFIDIIAAESTALSQAIQETMRSYGEALKASLVLEDMRAVDLLRVAEGRLRETAGVEVELGAADDTIWLPVDSFALVHALAFLAHRLKADYQVRRIRLSVRALDRFAEIDMAWRDAVVGHDALSLWEVEPMAIGTRESPLSLRDVLERHGAEAWLHREGPAGERMSCFRFLLPMGEPGRTGARPSVQIESRPEYYDFDLFAHDGAAQDLKGRKLVELAYTVFDTETTGLAPSAGDEIISIGAVRIVNGRLLKNETFEQMVDPQRPLDPDSAQIHGIDPAALSGQPRIEEVLPAFHRFCEDTVLVAHNAAFDMRFLELKEKSAGVRFDQPVLDTLLLSAAVHPDLEDHRLESIAARLGLAVVGRHTALGDALLTGDVFQRLLALLRDRGIVTLGEALDASRETYYARLRY